MMDVVNRTVYSNVNQIKTKPKKQNHQTKTERKFKNVKFFHFQQKQKENPN